MAALKIYFTVAATVALITVSGILFAWIWLAYDNTPAQHPEWLLSKLQRAELPGSETCKTTPSLFSGGHLNLSACNGYQEALYHTPLKLAKVSFRFQVDERGYVAFIGYDSDGFFDAFRFSGWENHRSAWLTGHRSGRFMGKTVGRPAIFYPYLWHEVDLFFENGKVALYVDGEGITQMGTRLANLAQVGFRSGLGGARVDDVVIETTDGTVIRADFENRTGLVGKLPVVYSALLLLLAAVLLLARGTGSTWGKASEHVFAASAATLLVSVMAYHYHAHTQRGFSATPVQGHDAEIKPNSASAMRAFQETHSLEKEADEIRVLFLGSDQTYGAGAHDRRGFVKFTDIYLPKVLPGVDARVMNGALPNASMEQLLALHQNTYRAYQPDIVVLVPSIKEGDDPNLKQQLETFISLNREDGVETILMLEAVSAEDPRPLPKTHDIVREVAKANSITLVDAHKILSNIYDSGFLFWDYAYPTDYGHDMISQGLLPAIRRYVERVRQGKNPVHDEL